MTHTRSILKPLTLAAALCFGFAGTNAFADASCKADVEKFCPQVQAGGGRIAQCLKEHKGELSAPCQERIKQVAAQLKEVKQACADDLRQHCPDVKPGGGRVGQCLQQHQEQLSSECKEQIAKMLEKKS